MVSALKALLITYCASVWLILTVYTVTHTPSDVEINWWLHAVAIAVTGMLTIIMSKEYFNE